MRVADANHPPEVVVGDRADRPSAMLARRHEPELGPVPFVLLFLPTAPAVQNAAPCGPVPSLLCSDVSHFFAHLCSLPDLEPGAARARFPAVPCMSASGSSAPWSIRTPARSRRRPWLTGAAEPETRPGRCQRTRSPRGRNAHGHGLRTLGPRGMYGCTCSGCEGCENPGLTATGTATLHAATTRSAAVKASPAQSGG